MRCLIFGDGFIGNKILSNLPGSVMSPTYISGRQDVIQAIKKNEPDVVINCVGKTGNPNIDWCESHKSETMFSNLTVPLIIAQVCFEMKIKMVHISTGCIYEGGVFWEDDKPNYVKSYYTKTKYLAEQALKEFDVLQLRIRMPIDTKDSPRNLINKLLSYDRVINAKNSITVLDDFIYALSELLAYNATGVYNVVNPDAVTHKEIIDIFTNNFKGVYINPEELMTLAGRSNCVLSTSKLNELGIFMRPTIEALKDCASKYEKRQSAITVS